MDWPVPSEPAKQMQFGMFVGISQPAVSALVAKGVLRSGGTYDEWLAAYLEGLRSAAAGRDQDERLSAARIRETEMSANLKHLEYEEKLKRVVWVDDVRLVLDRLVSAIHTSVLSARERIIEGIESKHSIKIDDELIGEPLRAALASVASSATQLGAFVNTSTAEAGAPAADSDGGMVTEISQVAAGER